MSVSDRSVFTLAFHDLLFEVIFIDIPSEENIIINKRNIANMQMKLPHLFMNH